MDGEIGAWLTWGEEWWEFLTYYTPTWRIINVLLLVQVNLGFALTHKRRGLSLERPGYTMVMGDDPIDGK